MIYAILAEGKTAFETSEFTNQFRTNQHILSRFIDRKMKIDGNRMEIVT
jgi:hypothetical protein